MFRELVLLVENNALDRIHLGADLRVDDVSDGELPDLWKVPFCGITEYSCPLLELQVRVIAELAML